MTELTGGEIIARTLTKYGITHAAGIPGHGVWSLLDGFLRDGSDVELLQVFHEQSAIHMADGFWRSSGRPMAALTSIGPGAANQLMGLATALADSASLISFSGGPATHMRGHGIMQELDRHEFNGFQTAVGALTKRHYEARTVEELPFILHRAFSAMLTGRPGPVHVEVPMDVQAASADVTLHELSARLPTGRPYPDPAAIEQAARLLSGARRPVIAVGGGAISAGATPELITLAEALRSPVVVTWQGKSGFPEDHELFAGPIGQTGTTVGNQIAAGADVVLSVGCRFTDWSASSYRKGVTFSLPPGKLIQVDLEPQEIGKNYPVAVGIVSDAKASLAALNATVTRRDDSAAAAQLAELVQLRTQWAEQIAARTNSGDFPFTSQRPLRDLRRVLDRDAFVIAGSGNPQGAVKQSFEVYEPRTYLTSGGYSSMGWAVPAAIGAKLANPTRQVACVVGDGDFLMTAQELGVVAQHSIPVCFVVPNNRGYMSIRGGQRKITDRHVISEFARRDGSSYGVDIATVAKGFGVRSWRVESTDELESTLKAAVSADEPTVVEVPTARDAAGPWVPGWWDFPVPAYITDERQVDYWAERAEEQHQ